MSRSNLSSLSSTNFESNTSNTSSSSSIDIKLPPLSSLLMDSKIIHTEPLSPNNSKNLITNFKTPIKLPSFDSLKFNHNKDSKDISKIDSPIQSQFNNSIPITSTPLKQNKDSIKYSPLSNEKKQAYAFISHSPSTFPSQEPSIDNHQLARRKRRRTSPTELSILQLEFLKGSTPNRQRRIEIANRVNMTEKAVQIWFQNRRQTLRRQSNSEKEVHHLEPIYHSQFNTSNQSSTPPKSLDYNIISNPTNSINNSSIVEEISPLKSTNSLKLSNLLVTPDKTPGSKQQQLSPNTLTFRLKHQSSLENNKINRSKHQKVLTPIVSIPNKRQKPMMKINIGKNSSSSPIKFENKENFPSKHEEIDNNNSNSNLQLISSPTRIPLKELSFNSSNKPNKNDDECVVNLLNLKNWKS
ncbi:hypothetical protein WICMUC_003889 [Wickerhamomyces mucosus]|uniref:Homeobox domain-containing protein n=1 Tax=Wickerhamomyces mucosus TaxID=1378264 RepID=A0A9P8TCB5_9ASCO|nr:hypothetical protein WICMUC_003889 [Wickerhamomyces mucosus]